MKRRSPVRALGVAALATLAALGALALGLELAGYDALRALGAMWRGAFGSWYAVTSATLVRAVPLVVLGLAVALAFHAGAFNIGAEGQFHAGAVAATWIGLLAGGWHPALAVTASWAAALLAGALWVSVPAWLRARFGVLEVISTLLLNFVADALVSLLVQGPLKERNGIYPQSDPIALAARLPLLSGTRLHLGLAVALGLAAALAVTLERTHAGFRLRAVGAGPEAARASGRIDVTRVVVAALLASGALAGLAGALEVGGVTYALFQNLSPGYGYSAIAVALLGRLRPLGVVAAGLLFAALEAGAAGMQREAGVPSVAVYVVEAVILLLVLLAGRVARRGAP